MAESVFAMRMVNFRSVMYRSNRSFNIPLQFPLQFPPTRAKMSFKCPTLGSIQVIKCPHPGDISQAHK